MVVAVHLNVRLIIETKFLQLDHVQLDILPVDRYLCALAVVRQLAGLNAEFVVRHRDGLPMVRRIVNWLRKNVCYLNDLNIKIL